MYKELWMLFLCVHEREETIRVFLVIFVLELTETLEAWTHLAVRKEVPQSSQLNIIDIYMERVTEESRTSS